MNDSPEIYLYNGNEDHLSGLNSAKKNWGNPLAYEQNDLYISQALRKGGLIFKSQFGWLATAFEYGQSDYNIVVSPIADSLQKFLPQAISFIQSEGLSVTGIKHVPSDQLDWIKRSSLFEVCQHDPEKAEYLEDLSEDTFPQVIIDIKSINWINSDISLPWSQKLPSNKALKEFRKEIESFDDLCKYNNYSLEIHNIEDVPYSDTIRSLDYWFESIRKRYEVSKRIRVRDFDSCFRDPPLSIIDYIYHQRNSYTGYVFYVNKEPLGAWIGSPISDKCFGVYVLYADTHLDNLSDYVLYHAVRSASIRSYKCVNLGGSELEGLYRFKSKILANGSTGKTRTLLDLRVKD